MKARFNISLIFLSAVVLVQSFSILVIEMQFSINKAYIEKNLCMNRSKPKLCCHGKCYLKKQLKKETEQSSEQSKAVTQFPFILFYSEMPDNTIVFPKQENISTPYFFSIINGGYWIQGRPPTT